MNSLQWAQERQGRRKSPSKQRTVTLALIAARASNPFSLQIEQYFQIISNCSKVLPSPFMLGNLCPSQTGTKGSKILLYASSSELLFQEPFLLFSQPAFQVLLQNEVLALGTRLTKIERKQFFFYLNCTINLPSVIWVCNVSTQKRKTGRGPRFPSELGTTEHGRRRTKKEKNEVEEEDKEPLGGTKILQHSRPLFCLFCTTGKSKLY